MQNTDFAKRLISWYLEHKRDLPWRHTTNPYHIWLSEVMLQQTRVSQGTPYYFVFLENFPTVTDLANATEHQVLKLWQGLGYYSRARNLHATAQTVADDFNGIFPSSYLELLKLKGIGQYTAAAIASFCYDEAVPVVDGNVFRVLARIFDVKTDIASPSAKKEFSELATALLPANDAATFNQAIMEFGALQCTPKNPDCLRCPFNDICLALKYGIIQELPVKLKKQKVITRYFNYLVYTDANQNTLLNMRSGKGIWENLYEFPLIESGSAADISVVSEPGIPNEILSISELEQAAVNHRLSHQLLKIKFWNVRVNGILESGISSDNIRNFPVPVVIGNFIEKFF